jgi:hypothetical protein
MAWAKVKWIPRLFEAFNTSFPSRLKLSDGTIGDTAHQGSTSGHNPDDTSGSKSERTDADSIPEVRAADVTSALGSSVKMYDVVQRILASKDKDRLIYIICDGWIWQKKNGWRREVYTGSNKHFHHAHFSGDPAYDEDTSPWLSILSFKSGPATPPPSGGVSMADSEFHTGAPNGPFLTQGAAGYAGQQRDTALAFAWSAAVEAGAAAASAVALLNEVKADLAELKAKLESLSAPAGTSVGKLYVDVEKLQD